MQNKRSAGRMARAIVLGCMAAVVSTLLLVPALSAAHFPGLQLSYLANFAIGSLGGSVDRLGIGTLSPGDSQVVGSNPSWTAGRGDIALQVTRPATYAGGPVSAGLYATPVDFAAGSRFGLKATFIAPRGSHATGIIWAVGLAGRTGDQRDLAAETRIAAALQVRGATARLSIPGGTLPPGETLTNLPQSVYDAIFDADDPKPFTLSLFVDRVTGASSASLEVDGATVASHAIRANVFPTNAGPTVTAVGPSIVVASGAGESASVRLRSFEIFTVKNRCSQGQMVC